MNWILNNGTRRRDRPQKTCHMTFVEDLLEIVTWREEQIEWPMTDTDGGILSSNVHVGIG